VFNRGPLMAFQNTQYRLLWGASLFSILSFFMVIVARGWLILELTDSPFMVTAINAVPMLPMLVLSPIGGVIADRFSRRLILMAGDLLNAAVLLTLALLILSGDVQVWQVFALSFLHGVVFSTTMPARMAAVPDVVEPQYMARGIAMFTTIFSTAQLAGPAPAGFLIEAYGMGPTFLVASSLLIPALTLLLFLDIPRRGSPDDQSARGSFFANIAEALIYVRGRPLMYSLLLMGVVFSIFSMPYQAMLPVFARDVLQMGPDGLGALTTSVGVGALVGSIAVAAAGSDQQLRFLLVWGGVCFGVLILLFASSVIAWLSFGLAILLGFAMQISLTSNMTVMQMELPAYIRGRVISIRMVAIGLAPAGMLALGGGAEVVGPRVALATMGAISTVLVLLMVWAFPVLRHAESRTEAQGSPVPGVIGGTTGGAGDGG
jgi:MFS family permease